MDARRSQRVAEALREELGELINYELDDPRVGAVTVTEVIITPDLRQAHVRVLLDGDADQQAITYTALDHARHYLRHALAERLEMYRMPELHFVPEEAQVTGRKAQHIRRRIRRGRPRDLSLPTSGGEESSIE